MSLPDIIFENIRPLDGNRYAGFDEMCCQLASLEPASSGVKFYRTGHGGDGGVEFYCHRGDGAEVGWQAKYLFHWNDSLKTQLDNSIRTALNKHPNLVEYIVCLPFDLSDSRTGKAKSAREKWDAWCTKWNEVTAKQKRNLTITLWGKSELSTRLSREDPAYSGRVLYWFDREALTAAWFQEQFGKSKASLGNRYTPETHVELPIRQDLLAFARHPELQKQIDGWCFRVAETGSDAVDAIRSTGAGAATIHSDPLAEAIRALTSLLDRAPIGPERLYPIDDWTAEASLLLAKPFAGHTIFRLPQPTAWVSGPNIKRDATSIG